MLRAIRKSLPEEPAHRPPIIVIPELATKILRRDYRIHESNVLDHVDSDDVPNRGSVGTLIAMAKYLELRGGTLDTAVKGTNFRQRHVPTVGTYWFTLEAEPRNKADPNAVMVIAKKPLGYLPSTIAPEWSVLCRRIRRKRFSVEGEVRLTPDGRSRWVLLWLPYPEDVAQILA